MADFPDVGCRAVAQYPSSYEVVTPAVIQRYVDGGEQRFAAHAPMRRIWKIRWGSLDEASAVRVQRFFESVSGRAVSFRFQDPWTGAWFENCWFKNDELAFEHIRDGIFTGELEIYSEDA